MKKLMVLAVMFLLFTTTSFPQTKETRDVDDFTRVSFAVAGKLVLKQGNTFSVVLEGDKDLLDLIETTVKNGSLSIKRENWRTRMNEKVTAYVTMPVIEGLSVSGSGNLVCDGSLECTGLDLNVSGSGLIELTSLSADEVDASISGSGTIRLEGSGADEGTFAISGSGGYIGEEFKFSEFSVSISGSGNCKCNVTGDLVAKISGSGGVYYAGNPSVDARVSGSGKVRKF
ncbi:MAG TPA: head GIN domain-containing protein [Bacteroidales bacterium]|nr:head GIN domain-containing protein [Bacteroidales bacterium]